MRFVPTSIAADLSGCASRVPHTPTSGSITLPCYTPATRSRTAYPTGDALLESEELAQRIADLLSDRQAEDIVLMDISKVSSFTDYFVVATAGNPRQMNALIDSVQRDLRPEGVRALRTEGGPDSGWVLIDFGNAVVHLFAPDERDYYNLEGLWSQGVSVVHIQ